MEFFDSPTQEEGDEKYVQSRLYVILSQYVYDLTEFQNFHPGGATVLQAFQGEDVSEIVFDEKFHKHSPLIQKQLKKYKIGTVWLPSRVSSSKISEQPSYEIKISEVPPSPLALSKQETKDFSPQLLQIPTARKKKQEHNKTSSETRKQITKLKEVQSSDFEVGSTEYYGRKVYTLPSDDVDTIPNITIKEIQRNKDEARLVPLFKQCKLISSVNRLRRPSIEASLRKNSFSRSGEI